MSKLQLTLALFKPDVSSNPVVLKQLRSILTKNNFIVAQESSVIWDRCQAESFYAEHKSKFFYQRLVEFMSSGEFHAVALAHPNAIAHWREMMGFTKCYMARERTPTSIRAIHGLSDTRNATHGSDSTESVLREVELLFPEWDHERWLQQNPPQL